MTIINNDKFNILGFPALIKITPRDYMPIKTTVITGATSGIGKETALALAKKDHALYLLIRDMEKGEAVRKELIEASGNSEIYLVHCNLADLKTVQAAAETLREKLFAINVLINNAGGIVNEYELSADGYEMTFALNHLGHFLLTESLMPLLERGQARIINVSSDAHRMGKPVFDDLSAQNPPGKYSAMKAYGKAKLFNIYFTQALAERYKNKGITAFALHPGVVSTNFGSKLGGLGKWLLFLARPFMITPEQGAQTSVYLATAAKLDALSGKYFVKQRVTKPAEIASNKVGRDTLWDTSMQMVQPFLK